MYNDKPEEALSTTEEEYRKKLFKEYSDKLYLYLATPTRHSIWRNYYGIDYINQVYGSKDQTKFFSTVNPISFFRNFVNIFINIFKHKKNPRT